MIIFIGISRAMLRMLQAPSSTAEPPAQPGEKFQLSHAIGLYALIASIPLAIFQPAALFDPLRAILAAFGERL